MNVNHHVAKKASVLLSLFFFLSLSATHGWEGGADATVQPATRGLFAEALTGAILVPVGQAELLYPCS